MDRIPTALIIMDGYGLGPPEPGNAIWSAETPELDRLISENPHHVVPPGGREPAGQMGNRLGTPTSAPGRLCFGIARSARPLKTGFFENGAYIYANATERQNSLLMGFCPTAGFTATTTCAF